MRLLEQSCAINLLRAFSLTSDGGILLLSFFGKAQLAEDLDFLVYCLLQLKQSGRIIALSQVLVPLLVMVRTKLLTFL